MINDSDIKHKSQYLSDVATKEKDKKWDKKRSLTQDVEEVYLMSSLEFHQKHAKRMKNCTGFLDFAFEPNIDTGELNLKLQRASFCDVRGCPICQYRRQLVWRSRAFEMTPKVKELYPKHRWLFLTLTVENVPVADLKKTVQHMQSSWVRFRKRTTFPGVGFIKSLEVTRQKSNGYAHPHFHILVLVPSSYFSGRNYITQQTWREIWGECLQVDYLPMVNVQAVKSKNPDDAHDVSGAIVEIIKYETKIAELQQYPDFLLEVALQLHRVRAVEVGGVLKPLISEEITQDDLLRAGDEPEDEDFDPSGIIRFNWYRGIRRYKRSR